MNRKYYVTGVLLIAATIVATAIVYSRLPNMVPVHWDFKGQANGYSPKWELFLMLPGIMAGIMVLFRFMPWLSPQRWEVDSFRSTYLYIMLVVLGMMTCLQIVTLWAGLGTQINAGRIVLGLVSLLFALLGNVLGKVRRNFYIGVRTPWTLANERVWNATHRLAAQTFVLSGLVGLVMTAAGLDNRAALAVLITGALIPVLYSLILYKQLERAGQL